VHTGIVDDHLVEFDFRIILGDLTRHVKEQPGTRLDDVGLVYRGHFFAAFATSQLERVAHDAFGGCACYANACQSDFAVFRNTLPFWQVRPFGIFTHRDDIDTFEARTSAGETDRRSDVGVEIEVAAKVDVDRGEAAANRRGQRAFECDAVFGDRIDGRGRHQLPMLLQGLQAGLNEVVLKIAVKGIEYA